MKEGIKRVVNDFPEWGQSRGARPRPGTWIERAMTHKPSKVIARLVSHPPSRSMPAR